MLTLRLTQHAESQPDRYRVEVVLEGKGDRLTSNSHFDFKVNTQDQEKIRWYLEDFLEYPQDPAPIIAANIEQRMTEIGVELFEKVFHANNDTRQVWEKLRHHISDTRVEIVTGVRDAAAMPWELIRDSQSDMPLALGASAFVRTTPQSVQRSQAPQKTVDGKIRILLVICRPDGESDVPFRSVATKLIKGLTDSASEVFQLDVLRPPMYSQLEFVLRQAKAVGQPYHIVHFDGHGEYQDPHATEQSPPNPNRMRGFLVFENPNHKDKKELMNGKKLGKLLSDTGVSLLLLNACRSAYAEAPAEPARTLADNKTRAYGSLAQDVMAAGVAGVVAMRYKVYVFTAAQFVANLYAALAQGQTLGEAVTQGRKQLHAQPMREIAYKPHRLQDWTVPVVYEAASVALFPKSARTAELTFNVSQGDAMPVRGMLDPQLPQPPNAGFFGRDETLLALDRAFDTQRIILLHAYAGSGKTSTVAEFGRWYALTGAVAGLVLFASFFERKLTLKHMLDKIGQVFGEKLQSENDEERREKALQLLREVPILWIWDNVEPVAGFPAGTESAWSVAEQQELVDFLREAQQTQAKFLLTSRRNEQEWLGDLPHRITVPWMPMRERVQLARAIAKQRGHQLTKLEDWRPLLRFTDGNPLTIMVLVGQALRDGLRSKQQIEDFVSNLRSGEAELDDDENQGRSKSLGASLSYGFAHAFSEEECQQLALLHLFQRIVNLNLLCFMGFPDADWCVPAVRGLTLTDGIALLDRATEIGLLTSIGSGLYVIHPALPWYFKRLFEQHYSTFTCPNEIEAPAMLATRAFVSTMGSWGNDCHNRYVNGERTAIGTLTIEEANLLHALKLARNNGWWEALLPNIRGLEVLYKDTGRNSEWTRLVKEIAPYFIDPITDESLPGREEMWHIVAGYRVRLAIEAQQWIEAERLQRMIVKWLRSHADSVIAAPRETLDDRQRNVIQSLAIALEWLGNILHEQSSPECVKVYKQAISLCQHIGDKMEEAILSFQLGHVHLQNPALRDFVKSEYWYQHSLELSDEHDYLWHGKCFNQMGAVSYDRFFKALEAGQPEEELLRNLNAAAQFYHQALKALNRLPLNGVNAVDDLAVTHNRLGMICGDTGDIDRALSHYREAIRYEEASGDLYSAANSCYGVAFYLARDGRFDEALLYAQAALRGFKTYGNKAAADIQKTQELIAEIEYACANASLHSAQNDI